MFGVSECKTESAAVSDPDRLQQLRRQRAAIATHLAWLDSEIKREARLNPAAARDELPPQSPETTTPPVAQVTTPTPVSPPTAPAPRPLEARNPSPALTADPDAVLEEWTEQAGADGSSDPPISKTGCWMIFIAIAVIGIGGAVGLIYMIYG